MTRKHHRMLSVPVKCLVSFLYVFTQKRRREISVKKIPNTNFHENPSSTNSSKTSGRTDMIKLIVSTRNCSTFSYQRPYAFRCNELLLTELRVPHFIADDHQSNIPPKSSFQCRFIRSILCRCLHPRFSFGFTHRKTNDKPTNNTLFRIIIS
jgi:hypothetical protein